MKKYHVPLVPQTKEFGCWSASIAMIVSWRDNRRYTSEEIAKACNYDKKREVGGLHPEDILPFVHWGLTWRNPQTYHVAGLYSLLQTHGPLWVATHEGSAHARVVVGMEPHPDPSRAKLYIQDPGPTLFGSIYVESFSDFCSKKDVLARRELRTMIAPVYTAHLKGAGSPDSKWTAGMKEQNNIFSSF